MKFIHIGDVHLGAHPSGESVYGEQRPRELWETFADIIEICEKEQTDLLLIAGDLFHRQPLVRELKEVNALFAGLSRTKVVLIAGNHDYIRRDSCYRTFRWNENVYPLFGREPELVFLEELDTAVYGFSYYEREIRKPLYDRLRAAGRGSCEILLAHGGDEKHIPIGKEALSGSGFDYIALGHIHRQQAVIPNYAVYSGALEPVDKNDTGQHGYIRGEITGHGVRTEFVPFAKREYRHCVLKVTEYTSEREIQRQIKEVIEINGKQHFYCFSLRGFRAADMTFDVTGMYLPGNVLELTDETEAAYDMERIREENRENIIGKYMELFDGCEEGSVEAAALREGLQALMENRMNREMR